MVAMDTVVSSSRGEPRSLFHAVPVEGQRCKLHLKTKGLNLVFHHLKAQGLKKPNQAISSYGSTATNRYSQTQGLKPGGFKLWVNCNQLVQPNPG
jgi:hypothetical protein